MVPSWSPSSWQTKVASQLPDYPDPRSLQDVLTRLARLPPLVTSWEIETLKSQLAEAARGEAFLLQGGDCSENLDEVLLTLRPRRGCRCLGGSCRRPGQRLAASNTLRQGTGRQGGGDQATCQGVFLKARHQVTVGRAEWKFGTLIDANKR